jgi:hypothetical protein
MDGPEITFKRRLPLLDSLESIKEASRLSGGHFFDPGTMRAFGSRLAPFFTSMQDADGLAAVFITSEKDSRGFMDAKAWGGARRYTVRLASFKEDGLNLDDCGPYNGTDHGFGAFGSLKAAKAHAYKVATSGTPERAAVREYVQRYGRPAPAWEA